MQYRCALPAAMTIGTLALTAGAVKPPAAAPATASSRAPGPFDAAVLKAAAEYAAWTRVSDRAHWAPADCRIQPPSGAQQSASRDDDTHGRKLYFLYAKDDKAWSALDWLEERTDADAVRAITAANIGQVLVKQSFSPVEVPAAEVPTLKSDGPSDRTHPPEFAEIGGTWFKTGEPRGLFIMLKLDPKTEGTDDGWVYATTSPDGKTILDAGRIASCMHCHAASKGTIDRLYGPPRARERWEHRERTK